MDAIGIKKNQRRTFLLFIQRFYLDISAMSDPDYDHIVVGAGINGLWTAYHLASRGASVLLLEKVSTTEITPLPKSSSSSSSSLHYSFKSSSSHCLTPGEVPTVRAEAFAGLTLTQVFNHHLFAIKPDYDYHHSAYPDPSFQK